MAALYSISEFAEKTGISLSTLRKWHKDGKLIPAHISVGGHRYFSHEQLLDIVDKKGNVATGMDIDILRDKNVLITGGSGSLGNHLVDRIKDIVRKVIVFSRDELKQADMQSKFKHDKIRYFLGDVRDEERLRIALQGVDICIHAAAMKRIEKCTSDPMEAIKTNVIGSMNVVKACMYNNVERALLVSTDKAAAPCTIYGGTKFVAEQLFINSNNYSTRDSTRFMGVRYGNVFGSRGSIIHLIKEQAKGGLVGVTHEDMTRFFMSLDDSVDLILYALSHSITGGELFVPKMKGTKIKKFAEVFAPGVPTKIIGIRGYEKINEDLITDTEMMYVVDDGKYYKIIPPHISEKGMGWDLTYVREPTMKSFKYSSNTVEQFTTEELLEFDK